MAKTQLELLAPAANLQCGISAIEHGADALYVGGPSFGARKAAANSLSDIAELLRYAHPFHVRVYATLNTLFRDDELEEAVRLCWKLYETGVDALIIQDMGLLQCDLPPLALHASTQTDNRLPQKVSFLQQAGFSRVILARELNLDEIRKIRETCSVPLEFFVHGALCVSYSGLCYISAASCGRSANRGECAQICRHRFTLTDQQGKVLATDKYLLSLHDLNLSAHLRELIDAGITSFKIEGRLKDENYVKNVTAFYRQTLDQLMAQDSSLERSSHGKSRFSFTPDPERTFNRQGRPLFLFGKEDKHGEIHTPKSQGKFMGNISSRSGNSFRISGGDEIIHNGDGLCYLDGKEQLSGIRVNRVENDNIHPREKNIPAVGTPIFRNLDHQFIKELEASQKCRKIVITMTVQVTDGQLLLHIQDETGISSQTPCQELELQEARDRQKMEQNLKNQLSKTGESIFSVSIVEVKCDELPFLPLSQLNNWRRQALENHKDNRLMSFKQEVPAPRDEKVKWPAENCSFYDNISNRKAAEFYKKHGVQPLLQEDTQNGQTALMTTRYCIRYQLDLCPKKNRAETAAPLLLQDQSNSYRLEFVCSHCYMQVFQHRESHK